ncbi:hypothetical protein B9Z19DRAFT_1065840 [Tuber borchii]|uniref:Uncharacterized protein n=1 Tax=Tuber borchii TaxID=42251 RepID=A0A2T6ZPL6_TUBBO|nr:hypothetical protein B9Z19DRAFT_1065840 [Tuber borchii]
MHWLTFSQIYSLVQRVISFLSKEVAAMPVHYQYHAASVAATALPSVVVYHCFHTGAVLDYGVSIMAQYPIVQSAAPSSIRQKFPSLEKRAKDTAKIQPFPSPQQHGQYNYSSFCLHGTVEKATTPPRTERDYQPEAIITHHSGCHLYDFNFLVNLDFLISSNAGKPNYATWLVVVSFCVAVQCMRIR